MYGLHIFGNGAISQEICFALNHQLHHMNLNGVKHNLLFTKLQDEGSSGVKCISLMLRDVYEHGIMYL